MGNVFEKELRSFDTEAGSSVKLQRQLDLCEMRLMQVRSSTLSPSFESRSPCTIPST